MIIKVECYKIQRTNKNLTQEKKENLSLMKITYITIIKWNKHIIQNQIISLYSYRISEDISTYQNNTFD